MAGKDRSGARGIWVTFTARHKHVFNPEPITEAWAMDWSDWPALGNMATPTTQGVESASPISMNDSKGGAVPKRKPSWCHQKVAMWVLGRKGKEPLFESSIVTLV